LAVIAFIPHGQLLTSPHGTARREASLLLFLVVGINRFSIFTARPGHRPRCRDGVPQCDIQDVTTTHSTRPFSIPHFLTFNIATIRDRNTIKQKLTASTIDLSSLDTYYYRIPSERNTS
jgi:hypothetical protein